MPPAETADDGRAECIDDQVPHRVGQPGRITKHGFLHLRAKQLIDRKLEYLPGGAGRNRKCKRKQRNETGPHMHVDTPAFVQQINQQESDNAQQQSRNAVQSNVPPPVACVVAVKFAQEKRGEYEQDRQQLEFGRNSNRQSITEQGRTTGDGHDGHQPYGACPRRLPEQCNQLHCHSALQHQQHAHINALGGPTRSRC